MGHDIMGYNREGEMIAYLRYTMFCWESHEIYALLEAEEYHGGVSGIGVTRQFQPAQIEKAIQWFNNGGKLYSPDDFLDWQREELEGFLNDCWHAAKAEGSVWIYFG